MMTTQPPKKQAKPGKGTEFRYCEPKYQPLWGSLIFVGCLLVVGIQCIFPKAQEWISETGLLMAIAGLVVLSLARLPRAESGKRSVRRRRSDPGICQEIKPRSASCPNSQQLHLRRAVQRIVPTGSCIPARRVRGEDINAKTPRREGAKWRKMEQSCSLQ